MLQNSPEALLFGAEEGWPTGKEVLVAAMIEAEGCLARSRYDLSAQKREERFGRHVPCSAGATQGLDYRRPQPSPYAPDALTLSGSRGPIGFMIP